MESLGLFFFSLFFPYFLTHTALCAEVCMPSSCGIGPQVRFPFWLEDQQTGRCGYPGFQLSCKGNQTILNLHSSGEFVIKNINYTSQEIYIHSKFCVSNEIMSFRLSNTPFNSTHLKNYTFFNCNSSQWPHAVLRCARTSDNYTVIAIPFASSVPQNVPPTCHKISTVLIPMFSEQNNFQPLDLSKELQLTWSEPDCKSCESQGRTCGLENGPGSKIGCNLPSLDQKKKDLPSRDESHGLPRSAKYGLIIGVAIPAFVCIIGLGCYISNRIRAYSRRRHPNTELPTTIIPQQASFMMGLDSPTIETYPKTVLGESGRLPKPNDATCPICLAEYQPKDTIRTIPECNHYFHAKCIDEWLRLNATCPVCRNSPESSLVLTPCSSMSSYSTSSLST